MSDAIVVERVGKLFRRHVQRPRTLSERIVRGWRRQHPPEPFWALRGVSVRVGRGRALGVIGKNGAGKSTLLRLVGGIGQPTEGRVATHGRLRALLELGSSFHHDLTGRENIVVAGVIAGLTRREVLDRFDTIVKFAELETFIDNPVRTFSSGMLMRLAFSVAVHTDPEILLVDEVLAVGDLGFQYKCLERIAEFRRDGCAVLIVSHDTTTMQNLCDDILWLRGGEVAACGEPREVIDRYVGESMAETRRRMAHDHAPIRASTTGQELRVNENRFGSFELEITVVRMLDAWGKQVEHIEPGEALTVEMDYRTSRRLSSPHFGIKICRADGLICYDVTTATDGHVLPQLDGQGRITLAIERLDLIAGDYFVDVAAYEREWAYVYDSHWRVYPLRIGGSQRGDKGIVFAPHQWRFDLDSPSGISADAPNDVAERVQGDGLDAE